MNLTNLARRTAVGVLSASALIGAGVLPAHAQTVDELVVVEPARATMFLNGGIGKSEEQYMRSIAKDWSLRMIFSASKDNEFLADVNLLVTDQRGTPYLVLNNAGPMTYAMLPAGKYRLTARHLGQSETREVTLDGKDGREVSFHWTAGAK